MAMAKCSFTYPWMASGMASRPRAATARFTPSNLVIGGPAGLGLLAFVSACSSGLGAGFFVLPAWRTLVLQEVMCSGDMSKPNFSLMYGFNWEGVAAIPLSANALRTASCLVMLFVFLAMAR